MIKKRNGITKLIGNSIISTPEDKQKRIELLRGSIIAGNDNEKIHDELKKLSNQEININTDNESVDDLYTDLENVTPILKASNATQDVHSRIYNIIDNLRTNRHISREQYHKYIKKHVI